jgi:CHAD domain-containing protein
MTTASGSTFPMGPIDPRRWLLQRNAYELLQKLEAAAENPAPEVVHRLRTGTRRSGALLESLLATPGRSREFRDQQKQAGKLLRQWKKLRRAAGQVRDLDVHLGLLEKLRKATAKAAAADLPVLQPQFDALETWLRLHRSREAGALQDEARKRLDRCRALTVAVLGQAAPAAPMPAPISASMPGPGPRRSATSPAKLALEDFYGVSQGNPHLGPTNLHDFRKATKQARYVAEAGQQQPDALAVDKALKRIQDAIGDWHDLDALHAEVPKALGEDSSELEALLRDMVEKKMLQAITFTERMRLRLLGERLALRSRRK